MTALPFRKVHCRFCDTEFKAELIQMPYGETIYFEFCSDECQQEHMLTCTELEAERNEFDRKRDAIRRYEKIVPPAMRATDLSRLPNIAKYVNWEPEGFGRGLIIVGKTGKGKTRLSYLMLYNLMVEKGLTVEYFRPGDFALRSHSAWMNNRAERFYDDMLAADIVFFDDFGKEKFTETRLQDLFAIINNRMDGIKPVVFTTNYYGNELIKQFNDPDFAEPFIRRIRESNETINLK